MKDRHSWSTDFVASVLSNPVAKKLINKSTMEEILKTRRIPSGAVIVFSERRLRERHCFSRISSGNEKHS
jgi:hypothetical protein